MNTRTQAATVTGLTILLILAIPTSMSYVSPLLAQSSETDGESSSASQDYQEFQSCLSDAEVDGTVSEQQIRDCFAPIYNTGTGTGSDDTSTTSTDSPPSDDDTSDADDTGSNDDEESGGAE
jgi:hypothetical protein